MTLFFVGILEMIIATIWTKFVAENKIFASGAITMVNIIIWYYVLQTIVYNINNLYLVLLYGLGCSIGTVLSNLIFKYYRKYKTCQTK